jgi:hypothetical protein
MLLEQLVTDKDEERRQQQSSPTGTKQIQESQTPL